MKELVIGQGEGQDDSPFFVEGLRGGRAKEKARHVMIWWFAGPIVGGKRRGWILRGMELRLSGCGGRKERKRPIVRNSDWAVSWGGMVLGV